MPSVSPGEQKAATSITNVLRGRWKLVISASTARNGAGGRMKMSVHPLAGRMIQPRPAARFEKTPATIRRPAPALGEHTEEILRDLGLDDSQIADLRDNGVVGTDPAAAGV